jgi:sialate O-acetylesterase
VSRMRFSGYLAASVFFAHLLNPSISMSEVRMPSHFSDGIVLQRDRESAIWGWGDPGAIITITIANHEARAHVAPDGRWMTALPELPATSTPLTIIVRQDGADPLVINDVLVGEVWLCSGQSNMAWPLKNTDGAEAVIAASADPLLRFFRVDPAVEANPLDDVSARWMPCGPETAGDFSGVAYYFGRNLRETLDVPVGLIQSAYGGTAAEPWISHTTFESNPALQDYRDAFEALLADRPDLMQTFREDFEALMKTRRDAEAQRRTLRAQGVAAADLPPLPNLPMFEPGGRYLPAVVHNAMLAPLIPYTIRGVTWYQGEANRWFRTAQYEGTLRSLIDDWRASFDDPQLPFLIVELANYGEMQILPDEPSLWAPLRNAQRLVADSMPNVAMIPGIDLGHATELHPRDKHSVGERLARLARAMVYGEQGLGPFRPRISDVTIDDEGILITLEEVGSGLKTRDGEDPKGFAVGSPDGGWNLARADIIAPDKIRLAWAAEIPQPLTIRHAWADNPIWNVVNSQGLPLGTFEVEAPTH